MSLKIWLNLGRVAFRGKVEQATTQSPEDQSVSQNDARETIDAISSRADARRGRNRVGDLELHERRRFDPEASWHEGNWSFYTKKGQRRKLKTELRIRHRVYSLYQLTAMLERAGWRYVKSHGEFDLTPFKPNSKRTIACCRTQL